MEKRQTECRASSDDGFEQLIGENKRTRGDIETQKQTHFAEM